MRPMTPVKFPTPPHPHDLAPSPFFPRIPPRCTPPLSRSLNIWKFFVPRLGSSLSLPTSPLSPLLLYSSPPFFLPSLPPSSFAPTSPPSLSPPSPTPTTPPPFPPSPFPLPPPPFPSLFSISYPPHPRLSTRFWNATKDFYPFSPVPPLFPYGGMSPYPLPHRMSPRRQSPIPTNPVISRGVTVFRISLLLAYLPDGGLSFTSFLNLIDWLWVVFLDPRVVHLLCCFFFPPPPPIKVVLSRFLALAFLLLSIFSRLPSLAPLFAVAPFPQTHFGFFTPSLLLTQCFPQPFFSPTIRDH